MRRIRNPVYGSPVPWVRIPPFPPEQVLLTRSVGLSGAQSSAPSRSFCYGLLTGPMATLRKNAERWTPCSGFLMLAHEYASVAPPKNSPTHAVGGCASRQVIVGRRQMSWQIHAVVKQPQNIDD